MVTSRFLLDTNVISEPIRPQPKQAVVRRIREHEREITIAAPVWHELLHGCHRLPQCQRRRAIEAYLFEVVGTSFPVMSYDQEAAAWHARERARLAANGLTPPFIDGQIAAIAAVNGLTLITANRKDFISFENLRVETW